MWDTLIEEYVLFRSNPDNDDKKDTIFAQIHGIALAEIKKLKRKNKEWGKKALEIRRDAYAERMTKVDAALFTAALSGDTKAADLLYRRFDGWNPKIVEQTNNYYNFAELVKGIKATKKATLIRREM